MGKQRRNRQRTTKDSQMTVGWEIRASCARPRAPQHVNHKAHHHHRQPPGSGPRSRWEALSVVSTACPGPHLPQERKCSLSPWTRCATGRNRQRRQHSSTMLAPTNCLPNTIPKKKSERGRKREREREGEQENVRKREQKSASACVCARACARMRVSACGRTRARANVCADVCGRAGAVARAQTGVRARTRVHTRTNAIGRVRSREKTIEEEKVTDVSTTHIHTTVQVPTELDARLNKEISAVQQQGLPGASSEAVTLLNNKIHSCHLDSNIWYIGPNLVAQTGGMGKCQSAGGPKERLTPCMTTNTVKLPTGASGAPKGPRPQKNREQLGHTGGQMWPPKHERMQAPRADSPGGKQKGKPDRPP